MVERLQQHRLFDVTHEFGAVFRDLRGHVLVARTRDALPHFFVGDAFFLDPVFDRKIEREANLFAAELLMPEPAVREAWERLGDVAACAVRFDVSPLAIEWRLYNFALIGAPPDAWRVPLPPNKDGSDLDA